MLGGVKLDIIFALVFLFSLLLAFIFLIVGVINIFKRKSSKSDFIKMLIFAGISFGAFLLAEVFPQTTEVSSEDETAQEFQEELETEPQNENTQE